MTPAQYRDAIKALGLSQRKAGLIFGYSGRSGQRWASGDYKVPVAVAIALKLMLETGKSPEDFDKDHE